MIARRSRTGPPPKHGVHRWVLINLWTPLGLVGMAAPTWAQTTPALFDNPALVQRYQRMSGTPCSNTISSLMVSRRWPVVSGQLCVVSGTVGNVPCYHLQLTSDH